MAEIARLEASPRGAYCGAIGWVRPGGDCIFSVPIRTAWLDRATGGIEYGTGGGVVWDSTADGEYDELRAKAVVAREPWPDFALLETLGLRDGRFTRRDLHLARMRASADRFDFPWPADRIDSAMDRLAEGHPRGDFLARLTLSPDGLPSATARPLEVMPRAVGAGAADAAALPGVALASEPVDSGHLFLFHKTTHRDVYDARRAAAPAWALDALLVNERGEVTEFTRGNLVLELDGARVTPARASGLLAGCLRQELLESGTVVERVVRRADLDQATRLWFVNSARGWIEVELRR
jgi:para-aminobenzoate synthetase/4-amino-4-deoxychorismate lyase